MMTSLNLADDAEVAAALDGRAMLLTIGDGVLHAGALAGLGVHGLDLRDGDRRFLADAATLGAALGRLQVLPYDVDAFDDNLGFGEAENLAGLAFVIAGADIDHIVFFDSGCHFLSPSVLSAESWIPDRV